jgi:cysteine dioxygenase
MPAPGAVRGLKDLLAQLDALSSDGPLTIPVLRALFDRLALRSGDLAAFQLFDTKCYRRNRIRRTEAYEMLLICWAPGQESPVHDHTGSVCAFQVLDGCCHEQPFRRVPDGPAGVLRARAAGSYTAHPKNSVCVSQDSDIHRVANLSPAQNLCTLHLYSPPLDAMRLYVDESADD